MNNFFVAMLMKNRAEKRGVTDSNEKNKIMLFPLFIKDTFPAILTSDLATQKAVESNKVRQLTTEKQVLDISFSKVKEAGISLLNELEDIKDKLKSDAENDQSDAVKGYCGELLKRDIFKNLEVTPVVSELVDFKESIQILKLNDQ